MVESLPENDFKEHQLGGMCHCWPELIFMDNGEIVVLHNAYDGRTGVEQA